MSYLLLVDLDPKDHGASTGLVIQTSLILTQLRPVPLSHFQPDVNAPRDSKTYEIAHDINPLGFGREQARRDGR